MAWFKKERKLRTSQRERLEIPADAWEKCDGCGHIDIREKFEKALNVCPECGRHRRISAEEYIELLTDPGSWRELYANLRSVDPLRFEHYGERLVSARKKGGEADAIYTGSARIDGLPLNLGVMNFAFMGGSMGSVDPLRFEHYGERLISARKKGGEADAIYTGSARIDGLPFNLGVMNFAFMGGSMGSVVGEKIARLARRSHEKRLPLVLVSTSGGARMQEGVLSLMQMAKTSAAIAQLHRASVPYISILTDPTTGGVSASFAMQGDVILAEPGAVIGFAGQRVIKQTIGQDLPEGFQTAEFLLEHGQIDDVVPRASLRDTTARLLRHMKGHRPQAEQAELS